LTAVDVDQCANLYTGGQTLSEIAEKFDTDASTIRRRLLKTGYDDFRPSGAPPRISDEGDKQTIVEHYTNGFSSSFLAIKFKCSRDAINKALDDAGVQRRNHLESVGLRWSDARGREHLMRSLWEVCTAQWLDDRGALWDYELKSYVVDDDGKRRRYTPDFWVYATDGSVAQIIEVKGWLSEACERRMNLFRQDHPELPFEVWEEADLKKRGILDVEICNQPARVKFAGSPSRMSNKERLQAMNLFDEGMSYANIAEVIQRGSSTVSSFLKSTGRVTTKAQSNRARVPQEDRDRAANLYAAGDSITTVAQKTGLSRDVVHGEIKRRGINRTRRGSV